MYRKKGSPYWWIAYRDAAGRKVERSTETTDRAQAALIESGARAAIWRERHQPAGAPVPDPLFDDLFADYLESAALRRDITRDVYAGRKLAAAFAGRSIRSIGAADMRRYADDRRRAGVGDSTLKRELNVLCAAINWARDECGLDLPNPAARRKPSEPPGRVRWLAREDAARLLAAARANPRAPWLGDFIQLALHTGMRKSEMLQLEWRRVDFHQGLVYLERQKNGRLGSVPLNAAAREALLGRARFRAAHCPAAPWVFVERTGARLASVKRSFAAACRSAGIADFHIHDLRHTCASWLVQAGVPLLEVAQVLRHASIATTQRYAHLAPQQARNAVARLEGAGDNLATIPDTGSSQKRISA